MIDQILAALRALRLHPVEYEHQLVQEIAGALSGSGIAFRREVKIGPRCRIDFVAGRIGIEVKKGKPNSVSVARQIDRYCEYDQIDALILVVERAVPDHILESNGKVVYWVELSSQWGIAL